jgi:hypothetical protein
MHLLIHWTSSVVAATAVLAVKTSPASSSNAATVFMIAPKIDPQRIAETVSRPRLILASD